MRRLLVNDALSQIEGTRTFWSELRDWFDMEFVGGDFKNLMTVADRKNDDMSLACGASYVDLIVRNATYFGPLQASKTVPTISLLQDIITEGPMREMQIKVCESSKAIVFNSEFIKAQYVTKELEAGAFPGKLNTIPLPVDFALFEPGNPMGLQQALGLPDGCVLWVGAHEGAAGAVKGWDIFLQVIRANPDIHFVGVFKDSIPDSFPPNLRAYCRLTHEELVKVIGACRVGLCTSRTESQHLAGIEMGACGLPLVVPNVGTYWKREGMPGIVVKEQSTPELTSAIQAMQRQPGSVKWTRNYWEREFSPSIIRSQWEKLIAEVESAAP